MKRQFTEQQKLELTSMQEFIDRNVTYLQERMCTKLSCIRFWLIAAYLTTSSYST